MTPVVSVVVPVYKTELYLHQCVDSILAQTLSDLELILVDDGSPDNCPAICDEYAARDGRVKVIHKENGGQVSAWKAGVQAAAADRIGFVDSDDWIDPSFYQELYTFALEMSADIVEGQYVREFPGDDPRSVGSVRSGTEIYEGEDNIRRLVGTLLTSFLYDGTPDKPDRPVSYSRCDKLYRRELLLQNIGLLDPSQTLAEDAIINTAVIADCHKIAVCQCAARYHYRILPFSTSHQFDEKQIRLICRASVLLDQILRAKNLDTAPASAFIGSMVHARIYRVAELPDVGTREKSRRMKNILKRAPDGALDAFVRARGDLFLRVFYGLLRLGLAAPCVWAVAAHGRPRSRK